MSSHACSVEAAINEQDNSADPLADSPITSRNAIKLPKILQGNASPINFDSNYDDLNKFSQNIQM